MSAHLEKIHFHSIDALRFFAFFKVYFFHVPIQGNFPILSFLKSGGGIGVSFFFVLSGFLITYLLMWEKLKTGHINVKHFLIRRSLRIWPLFFLVLTIVYFLPFEFKQNIGMHMIGDGYDLDWRFSFTFLENYKMLLEDHFPKTTPLSVFWSLCIEEHFYLFWLVSLFFIPVKYIVRFFVVCIFIAWGARFLEPAIFGNHSITSADLFTNLDYFTIGGLLGYFVAKDYKAVASFIERIPSIVRLLIITLIVLIIIFQKEVLPSESNTYLFLFKETITAICFTVLIAMFIPQKSSIKIKSKLLSYLGTISYGLYVYHIIFIHVVFHYFIHNGIKMDNWWTIFLFIAVTLGGSIAVSMISFHYFEKPFLRLRDKWTKRNLT